MPDKNYILFRLVPTMKCNYRCAYCFVSKKEKKSNSTLFDLFKPKEWIEAMKKWSKYNIEFYCWGGEPFLIDGTYELVKGWTEYEHVIPGSRIDTNVSFAQQIYDRCKTKKIKLNCSWHTQYDTFKEIYQKIKLLKSADMIGMLNFVASKQNIKVLEQKYNLQVNDLVNRFADIDVFVNIAADFNLLRVLKGESYIDYKRMILQYQCEEDWKQLRCEKDKSLCEANQYFFTLQQNGDLTPCLSDKVCGNFFKGNIEPLENEICDKRCPSIVAYPFRRDNSFHFVGHLMNYVNRNQEYRKNRKNKNEIKYFYGDDSTDISSDKESINSRINNIGINAKEKPEVSIILPTYNQCSLLPLAIKSILEQTYENYELIIINDCSTDDTQEYICGLSDQRIKIICNSDNRGLAESLNIGIRNADGKFLTWVSSDNYCAPTFVEAFVGALKNFPEAGFAYSAFAYIDENGMIDRFTRNQDMSYANLLKGNPGLAAFMYRREVKDVVGDYDPELEGAEDWDMWLRIIEKYKCVYVPEILYYYRLHDNSMTKKITRKIINNSQKTILKALRRKNGQFKIYEIYPLILECKDKRIAEWEAVFDFGTKMLQSKYAPPFIAVQLFEAAISEPIGNIYSITNLATSYGKAGDLKKAIETIEKVSNVDNEVVNKVARILHHAQKIGSKEILNRLPFFAIDKNKSELFLKERSKRKIYTSPQNRCSNNLAGN